MTRRRRFGYIVLGLLIILGIGAGSLFWASKQVPDFYEEAIQVEVDPEVRQESAKKFVQQTIQFVEEVKSSDEWSQEFTQHQINSWLIEDFPKKYAKQIPNNISNPRVSLTEETVQLGFKLEHPKYNGVISFRLKPFVTKDHQLAIEIESIRAGLLPVPLDEVLERAKKHLPAKKWQLEWSHKNGHDVVIINLTDSTKEHPQLDSIEIVQKAIRISGQKKKQDNDSTNIFPRLAEFPKEEKSTN